MTRSFSSKLENGKAYLRKWVSTKPSTENSQAELSTDYYNLIERLVNIYVVRIMSTFFYEVNISQNYFLLKIHLF